MNSLQNKRILIVGGSSGIGLAVTKQACKAGGKIIIASRNAAEKHDDLVSAVDHDIETYSFDVASEDETATALKKIGDIDHLVITARPDITPAPFVETDLKQAKEAFETKFWGQYQLIQKAQGQISQNGSIVMTTGIAGEKIFKNFSTMAIINSATEAFCRLLAIELAPIRVNVVSPGFVAPKSPEVEKYAQQFPSGRIASPEEVADAYIYLMGNPYTTGISVVIDGGARLM
ncbi:SDR family oxidoreductase [Desulfobacter sp.]|uniref:SDR family oxidoreductase n=1 Tax=Desulfobacter sp. TaxID=2294 RepID=UPI000E8A7D47|nr:SDR family oxidoreductase [Desulfobacter sp.]HBT89620.1 short-chain dehydrogenase [Desulfobacter sp.]